MATFTLTYKDKHTKEIVLQSLSKRIDSAYSDESIFIGCCGSIAYLSLFILPDYELADKKVYSIENVCPHVPGFFRYCMHDLLTDLGTIACSGLTRTALSKVLSNTAFFECTEWLGLSPVDWYRLFLFYWCKLNGSNVSKELLARYTTYSNLCNMFYGDNL